MRPGGSGMERRLPANKEGLDKKWCDALDWVIADACESWSDPALADDAFFDEKRRQILPISTESGTFSLRLERLFGRVHHRNRCLFHCRGFGDGGSCRGHMVEGTAEVAGEVA